VRAQPVNGSAKASGTRDRIVAWLADQGEINDENGLASTRLSVAVGYPGSSVAFAQLLSGMERAGLIVRQVRGKRTYQIALNDAGRLRASRRAAPGVEPAARGSRHLARRPQPCGPSREHPSDGPAESADPPPCQEIVVGTDSAGAVDYDELAQRLLVQVARRMATPAAAVPAKPEESPANPATTRWAQRRFTSLERKVADLEKELARSQAARSTLQEQNLQLVAELERTRRNLELVEARSARKAGLAKPTTNGLDESELALLQRMLVERSNGDNHRRTESA